MVANTLPSDPAAPDHAETAVSWSTRLQRAWPATLVLALLGLAWESASSAPQPPWLLVPLSAALGAVLALSAGALRRRLADRRAAPRAGADEALDALKRLDTHMLEQLRRATGLSETSALNMIERVAGLRQLSARLMGYLGTAHAQSTQMQAEIERNGSIIAEMAGFVKQLPQQIAHEREYLSQLVTDVRQLSGITETIRLMARQTEILSINAAIAAARAGEAGRGFSVLAGEVRRLAQQSNQAAQEIEQHIARLVDTVQMRTQGVFAQQLQSNEDEAARLLALTGKLDEGYLDMRQFYAMLLTAITEHNGALDHGITHLLDTAQYQDVFKQIVDRLHPAFRARDEVVEQWIGSLQGGQGDVRAIEARARELPDRYLDAEAQHRDPDAHAELAPGDPGQRIELF